MTQSATQPQNGSLPQTAKGRLELFARNLGAVVSNQLSEEQCAMLERSPVLLMLDKSIGFLKAVQKAEGSLRQMTIFEFLDAALRSAGVGKLSGDMTIMELFNLVQSLAAKGKHSAGA